MLYLTNRDVYGTSFKMFAIFIQFGLILNNNWFEKIKLQKGNVPIYILLSVSDIVPLIQCNIVFDFSCNWKVRYENQVYLLLGRLSYPICMPMC